VARALGAHVTNLACSGATFGDLRFGARYDRAHPDLVLVTAGANSVNWERAFMYCALAARGLSDAEATRIAGAPSISQAAAATVRAVADNLGGSSDGSDRPACSETNPGAFLGQTVLDRIDSVAAGARALANSIRARGRASGRVPEIVFTRYPDPLPSTTAALTSCPDAVGLGTAQLTLMHAVLDRLNHALEDGVAGLPGVRVVDPDPAYAAHRWCSNDPWTYGPSVLLQSAASSAPFHPTPAGQRAIAAAVLRGLRAPAPVGGSA
jgi:hypothetical protein